MCVSLIVILQLCLFLGVVHHIVELLGLRAQVLRELRMDMRRLQVFILFHVLYHHSDVILASICGVRGIDKSAQAATLGFSYGLRLVAALSRF